MGSKFDGAQGMIEVLTDFCQILSDEQCTKAVLQAEVPCLMCRVIEPDPATLSYKVIYSLLTIWTTPYDNLV